ncbi:MAG: MSMEG_0567/Sll0786 family nitrogen starvation N-acetyltransferase [Pseudomonadota bacterium]
MMFEPVHPYISPAHRVKFATEAWEIDGAKRLRKAVFVGEQQVFDRDDGDAVDAHAITIVALSSACGCDDEVTGTVRIHRGAAAGEWWGSRLAVARDYRRQAGLGTSLIRLAVSSAHAMGCTRFLAKVQSRNALLFQRLHWRTLEEMEYHGQPHHFMEADLAHYPPIADGARGFVTRTAA